MRDNPLKIKEEQPKEGNNPPKILGILFGDPTTSFKPLLIWASVGLILSLLIYIFMHFLIIPSMDVQDKDSEPVYKSEYELECTDEWGNVIDNKINLSTVLSSETKCQTDTAMRINITNYNQEISYTISCKVTNCNPFAGGI